MSLPVENLPSKSRLKALLDHFVRISRDGGHRFHLIVGSDFTG